MVEVYLIQYDTIMNNYYYYYYSILYIFAYPPCSFLFSDPFIGSLDSGLGSGLGSTLGSTLGSSISSVSSDNNQLLQNLLQQSYASQVELL